jgi:hypothetical protein
LTNIKSVIIELNRNTNQFDLPKDDCIIYSKINKDIVAEFLKDINECLYPKELNDIRQNMDESRSKALAIILLLLLFNCMIIVLSIFYEFINMQDILAGKFIWRYIILIIFSTVSIFIITKLANSYFNIIPQSNEYEVLRFRLNNYYMVDKCLNDWNNKLFSKRWNNILVSIPVNLEYIHFIINQEKEIQLEHHMFNILN